MPDYRQELEIGRATHGILKYYSLQDPDDILYGWETRQSLLEFERRFQEEAAGDYDRPHTTHRQHRLIEDSYFDKLRVTIEHIPETDMFKKQAPRRLQIHHQQDPVSRAQGQAQTQAQVRKRSAEVISLLSPTPVPLPMTKVEVWRPGTGWQQPEWAAIKRDRDEEEEAAEQRPSKKIRSAGIRLKKTAQAGKSAWKSVLRQHW